MSETNKPQEEKDAPEPRGLSNIPPELRNKIYELLLNEDNEVVLNPPSKSPVSELRNLSGVDQKTRLEARSMYFSLNQFRIQNSVLTMDARFRFLDLVPENYVRELKHLTINTFLGLSTLDPEKERLSYRDLPESDFCFDLGLMQASNMTTLVTFIHGNFKDLTTFTLEFSKVVFLPFTRYAADGVLGLRVSQFAKCLQILFALPHFKELILVPKQDVKLDWFAGKVLEGTEWTGDIKIKQG